MISYWGVEHGDEISKMSQRRKRAIGRGAAHGALVSVPIAGVGVVPGAAAGAVYGAARKTTPRDDNKWNNDFLGFRREKKPKS
jgi:hypothetical protein